jgi:apolipoprotein N-acyltransferase
MEQFVINLGGTSGTRAIQESRETFQHTSKNIQVAPVICYESVFGEYVTKYIQQGASLIFIITNDGWLRSPGYQQHLHFARLRAIETRRSIARSANTGISGFINQKGQLLKATEWWEKKAIKGTLYANNEKTFYVKYGDFVGRISAFLAVFVLLYLIAKMLMKRTKHADMLLRLRE